MSGLTIDDSIDLDLIRSALYSSRPLVGLGPENGPHRALERLEQRLELLARMEKAVEPEAVLERHK